MQWHPLKPNRTDRHEIWLLEARVMLQRSHKKICLTFYATTWYIKISRSTTPQAISQPTWKFFGHDRPSVWLLDNFDNNPKICCVISYCLSPQIDISFLKSFSRSITRLKFKPFSTHGHSYPFGRWDLTIQPTIRTL